MNKRVAILCSDGAHHKYLTAALSAQFQVVALVVESEAAQCRRLLQRRKARDYFYRLYHRARRKLCGLDAYRRRYFALPGELAGSTQPGPLNVGWVNDPEVVELLRRAAPDVTVVMGTSILRCPVLEAAGASIINIHGGHLPHYRGNHCFFFAMYNGEFDKIGSTIHFIDAGIDTGDIIDVVVPELRRNDTPETLYCRAERMAIHRLIHRLGQAERGESLPRTPQLEKGVLYRTSDRKPHHDILFFLRRVAGRLVVPEGMTVGGGSPAPEGSSPGGGKGNALDGREFLKESTYGKREPVHQSPSHPVLHGGQVEGEGAATNSTEVARDGYCPHDSGGPPKRRDLRPA
jgi:methionyl-tRNA formyltransferase